MKKVEIFFRNLLLKLLLLISSSKQRESGLEKSEFSKILFIRLNRIGDALVTTPLLHLIKKELGCKIFILADKKNHFVFENNEDIDSIIIFEKGLKGIRRILNFIRKENIQTVVDLHDDVSTTVSFLIALSKAKNKFGLEKENKNIYTKIIPKLDPKNTHVVDRILELSKLFGIEKNNEELKIIYNSKKQSKEKVKLFLQKHFIERKFLIGINISAGSDARFWGIENFKSLLNFLSNYDLNIILLCAPNDLNLASQITQQNVIFYSPSFDEFASMIFELDMLFTPDTMAVHLAAVHKIPVFGIYVNDTEDMIWTPYKTEFDCVTTKKSNLKNITFVEVKEKLKSFLEKTFRWSNY